MSYTPADLAGHRIVTQREGLPCFGAVDARQIIFLNNTRRCFSPRITSCSSGSASTENTKCSSPSLPSLRCTPTPSSLYCRSPACRYFSQLYEVTPLNIFTQRIFTSPVTPSSRVADYDAFAFCFFVAGNGAAIVNVVASN